MARPHQRSFKSVSPKSGPKIPKKINGVKTPIFGLGAVPTNLLGGYRWPGAPSTRPRDLAQNLARRDRRAAAMTDHLSETGARELAARLREFWRQRGHRVSVWTEAVTLDAKGRQKPFVFHVVRSDLTAGLPLPTPRLAAIKSTAP
jgi:hypothetical protein